MQIIDNINHLLGDPSTSEHVAAVKFCADNGTPRTIAEIDVEQVVKLLRPAAEVESL